MDELWQRYRSFWIPVLIGLGVFLVGLIVVHIITDDPDAWGAKASSEARTLRKKVEPSGQKIKAIQYNEEELSNRVTDWAGRLDQGNMGETIEVVVTAALQASILRGVDPAVLRDAVANPETPASRVVLEPFDGDGVAASKAVARYEEVRQDRLNILRAGDANVGFSRLLSDIWSEFRVRANRADVELGTDILGFGGVTSVPRSVLAQRLLNLGLVSQIVDLAIRSGVRSISEVRLEQKQNPLGDDVFLRQWPFTITVQGDMASIRPILSFLTDPAHPIPLTQLLLTQPPRTSPLEGQVQLQAKVASVLVRPDASLGLDMEEAR